MADDVAGFIQDHNLEQVALIGHSMFAPISCVHRKRIKINRGAKAAMTLSLRSPRLLRAVVAVDNAPVDASLSSDFPRYVQGLREIEDTRPQRQAEADRILMNFEKVGLLRRLLMREI